MKKSIFIALLIFTLLFVSTINLAVTDITVSVTQTGNRRIVYNDELQDFSDVTGKRVYPISYDGTTYLPIRAISSLFGTRIKWDGTTNSIYLGEGDLDKTSSKSVNSFIPGEAEIIPCTLMPSRNIYYNGTKQTFYDVNNNIVYPLAYEGTTYLPIRAISNLFNLNIDWDGNTNTVSIYSKSISNISNDDDIEIPAPSTTSLVDEAEPHLKTTGYTNNTGIWRVVSTRGMYDIETGTSDNKYSPIYIKQRKLYTGSSAEKIIENYNNTATFSQYTKRNKDNNLNILLYDVDLSDFDSSFITSASISAKTVVIDLADMAGGKLGSTYGVTYCAKPNELTLKKGINQMFLIFETPNDFKLSAAYIKFINEDDMSYENFFISTID